jgi:Tfp pilus assembly protein PilZ
MSKRNDKRVNKKFMVSFDEKGFDNLGLTENLSNRGLCIKTKKEIESSTEILLSIAVPGDIFNLKGEVVWCKGSENTSDAIPESIGIKITEAPAEYLNFVEFMKHQSIEPGKPEF